MSDSIIVSPVIEENNGVQKIKSWNVHFPPAHFGTRGDSGVENFKTKKQAFIFAHKQGSNFGMRVQEKGIHKPKLDTEKM